MMWRGGPIHDAEPVPLRETVPAAIDAVRLAWEADRTALLLLVAVNAATTAAEIAQLLISGRAVDAVVDGERARSQTARLLVLGALGAAAVVGKSAGGALSGPVTQAAQRRAEGRLLDVGAALDVGG